LKTENKILLILDLDETLIHATRSELHKKPDFVYADYNVYIRPNLKWFLECIHQHFKIAIWSSADDIYVEDIVDKIKPDSVDFEFVWGRSRCTTKRNFELDEYVHEKRLKKIKNQGFLLEKALIVDDSPEKTRDNFGNVIYIAPFKGEMPDDSLLNLHEYLMTIKEVENVRKIEKRGWENRTSNNN